MNGRDMQTMNDQELVNALREHAEREAIDGQINEIQQ